MDFVNQVVLGNFLDKLLAYSLDKFLAYSLDIFGQFFLENCLDTYQNCFNLVSFRIGVPSILFLFLCLFYSGCFSAVNNIQLQPTNKLLK